MKRMPLTAAVVSASLVFGAGCSSERSSNNRAVKPKITSTTPGPTNASNNADEEVSRFNSMNLQALTDYRNKVASRHMADVLMGWCIGWPTANQEIAVTINPGLTRIKRDGRDLLMILFGRNEPQNSKTVPAEVMMNGPTDYYLPDGKVAGDMNQALYFHKNLDPSISSNITRKLSTEPIRAKDGIWAYTDEQSGQPVIKTTVTEGPFSEARVREVCEQLQPGFSDNLVNPQNPPTDVTI